MPSLSPEHEAFGRAIRMLRARDNLSQEALANAAGMDRSYVGSVERGETNVGYSTLHRLAAVFGLRASDLVRRAEDETEVPVPAAGRDRPDLG